MSVGFGRVINRNYSDTKQRVPLAAGFLSRPSERWKPISNPYRPFAAIMVVSATAFAADTPDPSGKGESAVPSGSNANIQVARPPP